MHSFSNCAICLFYWTILLSSIGTCSINFWNFISQRSSRHWGPWNVHHPDSYGRIVCSLVHCLGSKNLNNLKETLKEMLLISNIYQTIILRSDLQQGPNTSLHEYQDSWHAISNLVNSWPLNTISINKPCIGHVAFIVFLVPRVLACSDQMHVGQFLR